MPLSVAMFLGTIWGTEGTTALSSLGQGGHQFANVLTQLSHPLPQGGCHCSPGPTFSWVASFLLSAFQVATISYNMRYQEHSTSTRQNHGYVCEPHERGHEAESDLGSLPTL